MIFFFCAGAVDVLAAGVPDSAAGALETAGALDSAGALDDAAGCGLDVHANNANAIHKATTTTKIFFIFDPPIFFFLFKETEFVMFF